MQSNFAFIEFPPIHMTRNYYVINYVRNNFSLYGFIRLKQIRPLSLLLALLSLKIPQISFYTRVQNTEILYKVFFSPSHETTGITYACVFVVKKKKKNHVRGS